MSPDEIGVALGRSAGGRYAVPAFVGSGGMALVFSALDERLHRRVAIKVIRPELLQTLARERFMREIAMMATLSHPAIVPLFDSGEADGLPFYVMPWIDGESLQHRLDRNGPLPVGAATRIIDDVAAGLEHAHAHGIVHRDVKPGNILLAGDRALVSDFGIARAAANAALVSLSTMGVIVGSPNYMSPEQAAGEHDLSPASDQYSLACVFFEMLAGCLPLEGGTPQRVLAQHVMAPPRSLKDVGVIVPKAVDEAIAKALSKAPGDRFASTTAFVAAVREGVPYTGESAHHAPTPRWPSRAAVAAALLIIAGSAWAMLRPRHVTPSVLQVVGFPLTTAGGDQGGEGDKAALYLGSMLTQVEGLRWIDGWNALSAEERAHPESVSDERRSELARRVGAQRFVDGRILRVGDSVQVVLRLVDTDQKSAPTSAAAMVVARTPTAFQTASVRALSALLPSLIGREGVEAGAMAALGDRDPPAIIEWLTGERYFRRARYDSALAFLESAVKRDSGFAIAALRAAEAADAEEQYPKAARLAKIAARQAASLTTAYALYARGLNAVLHGQSDSAAIDLEASVEADSTLARAWYVLGDIYANGRQHTMPNIAAASRAFNNVLRFDPDHAPSLHRLASLALRQRDLVAADSLIQKLARQHPSERQLLALRLTHSCLQAGITAVDWNQAVIRSAHAVALAGGQLAAGGLDLECAAAAFRAVLASHTDDSLALWAAAVGLNASLLVSGDSAGSRQLIDEESHRQPAIVMLHCLNWQAGFVTGKSCARAAAANEHLMKTSPWTASVWGEIDHKPERIDSAAAAMEHDQNDDDDPSSKGVIAGIRARAALVRGDTTGAIRQLNSLATTARSPEITWGLPESLAAERLYLCHLSASLVERAGSEDSPIEVSTLQFFMTASTTSDTCRRTPPTRRRT